MSTCVLNGFLWKSFSAQYRSWDDITITVDQTFLLPNHLLFFSSVIVSPSLKVRCHSFSAIKSFTYKSSGISQISCNSGFLTTVVRVVQNNKNLYPEHLRHLFSSPVLNPILVFLRYILRVHLIFTFHLPLCLIIFVQHIIYLSSSSSYVTRSYSLPHPTEFKVQELTGPTSQ